MLYISSCGSTSFLNLASSCCLHLFLHFEWQQNVYICNITHHSVVSIKVLPSRQIDAVSIVNFALIHLHVSAPWFTKNYKLTITNRWSGQCVSALLTAGYMPCCSSDHQPERLLGTQRLPRGGKNTRCPNIICLRQVQSWGQGAVCWCSLCRCRGVILAPPSSVPSRVGHRHSVR